MSERDQLIDQFTAAEVETAEGILSCMRGPVTTGSLRRLLLLFLRGHYASSANYGDFQHLACFTWAPAPTSGSLSIEFTHNDNDQKPDNYPGIFVGFAQTPFEKIALGNFAGHSGDTSGTHLVKQATASFEISHVAQDAGDAYDLAEMTASVLTAMADPLVRNAGAKSLEVVSIAPPTRKKPSPDKYYTVAANVQISYSIGVTRTLESHRIRRIIMLLPPPQS